MNIWQIFIKIGPVRKMTHRNSMKKGKPFAKNRRKKKKQTLCKVNLLMCAILSSAVVCQDSRNSWTSFWPPENRIPCFAVDGKSHFCSHFFGPTMISAGVEFCYHREKMKKMKVDHFSRSCLISPKFISTDRLICKHVCVLSENTSYAIFSSWFLYLSEFVSKSCSESFTKTDESRYISIFFENDARNVPDTNTLSHPILVIFSSSFARACESS